METIKLRQFKTIIDVGGLLKASEMLGITGGGLSKSMKSLEEEIGFKLFYQKGRGLELTKEGEIFYKKIPDILKSIDELFNVESAKEKNQTIRIASFEVFTTYFLSNFIHEFYQNEDVVLREAIPGRMEELVASGEAGLAITYEPIPHKGVEFLKITTLKMGIFVAKNSTFLKSKFSDIPFVIPIHPLEGTPSGVVGLDGWPDHQIERKINYKVHLMESALQLASKSLSALFIPKFVAHLYNENVIESAKLVQIPTPTKMKMITRDVFIIIPKGTEESALVKKMARALRRLATL